MAQQLKLKIHEVDIPWPLPWPFKGRLLAGTPSRNKPRATSMAAWSGQIVELATQQSKAYLAIPDSFWQLDIEQDEDVRNKSTPYIRIKDNPGANPPQILDLDGSLSDIIQHLTDGEDVLILSAARKISGFIPALFSMLSDQSGHIEKILYPIEHGGYVLTQQHRGYLRGIYDAKSIRALNLDCANADANGRWNDGENGVAPLSEESIGHLQKDIYWTRDQLQSLAGELFNEITPELMDIAQFLSECEEHPGADTTVGAMASITYRLCDVFKETANIGREALDVTEGEWSEIPDYQLGSRLAKLRGGHTLIAERLARLYDSALCFIPCDLDVLLGHPEITSAKHLQQTVKLIADQIEKIFGRLDDMRVVALNINQTCPEEQEPCKKDRDWKAVQAMLETCLQTCREKTETEPPRWVDKPTQHPKHGESGNIVTIKHPTKPSAADTWHSNSRTAIFVPGGKAPKTLNAVPVHAWRDHPRQSDDWNACDLLMLSLNELPPPKHSLPLASGVVAVEPDGRIWMVSPTNKFGGYETTFPKGKLDHAGLSLQANAIKEGYEESGLKVRITGYLGDFKRSTSITRLYLAERVGGDPTGMGWESQAVRLVPPAEWGKHLENPADQPVLAALRKHFGIEG